MLRNKLLTVATTLALSPAIHAATLAGGAMYGGPTQTVAACYIFNAGTVPVSIGSRRIIREPNAVLPLFFDNCGDSLAPLSSCGIAATIVGNAAHSCRMFVSSSGADVRGTFELRDANLGNILNNVELR